MQQAPNATPPSEIVALIGPAGRACLYDFLPTDSAFQYKTCLDLGDGDGGFDPPRDSVPVEWNVDIWDDNQFGTAAYWQEYVKYGDYVYLQDATPGFTNKWLIAESPLWSGTSNPPPTSGIKAGYFDVSAQIIYLIGP
jgi:hypothetical protein